MPYAGSGQDGEFRAGLAWVAPRFRESGGLVWDRLTGLAWTRDANLAEYPLTWTEALDFVARMNGARRSAILIGHPFRDVRDAYWSSTTSLYEPDWAWALYLDKGAVGVGQKAGRHFHVWPVADAVPATAPA